MEIFFYPCGFFDQFLLETIALDKILSSPLVTIISFCGGIFSILPWDWGAVVHMVPHVLVEAGSENVIIHVQTATILLNSSDAAFL